MPPRENEKTRAVMSFLEPLLKDSSAAPFFLGVNGIQGAGKTTLVNRLADLFREPPHSLEVAVLSIDDLYLRHADQKALASEQKHNPLVQHRGQPGTHDIELGERLFDDLRSGRTAKLPAYDKSAFDGEGDRVPETEWEPVNQGSKKVELFIFEGWCIGFKALPDHVLSQKWSAACEMKKMDASYSGRLGWNELESVRFINEKLKAYNKLTDNLDAFVHIDAHDTRWVYGWRLQAEQRLRSQKGSGMTDDQVRVFIDGYYPGYELYTEELRRGIFNEQGKQLRIVLNEDRTIKELVKI